MHVHSGNSANRLLGAKVVQLGNKEGVIKVGCFMSWAGGNEHQNIVGGGVVVTLGIGAETFRLGTKVTFSMIQLPTLVT